MDLNYNVLPIEIRKRDYIKEEKIFSGLEKLIEMSFEPYGQFKDGFQRNIRRIYHNFKELTLQEFERKEIIGADFYNRFEMKDLTQRVNSTISDLYYFQKKFNKYCKYLEIGDKKDQIKNLRKIAKSKIKKNKNLEKPYFNITNFLDTNNLLFNTNQDFEYPYRYYIKTKDGYLPTYNYIISELEIFLENIYSIWEINSKLIDLLPITHISSNLDIIKNSTISQRTKKKGFEYYVYINNNSQSENKVIKTNVLNHILGSTEYYFDKIEDFYLDFVNTIHKRYNSINEKIINYLKPVKLIYSNPRFIKNNKSEANLSIISNIE